MSTIKFDNVWINSLSPENKAEVDTWLGKQGFNSANLYMVMWEAGVWMSAMFINKEDLINDPEMMPLLRIKEFVPSVHDIPDTMIDKILVRKP